jgi:hypothetical protein
MRDEVLEFDSSELDDQELDLEDITRLLSPKHHTYSFEGGVIVRGPAVMLGDEITIQVAGERRTFARKDLVAIIPAAERERDRWSGKVDFGITVRSGNTNQTDMSTSAWLRRETAKSRFRTDYKGSYSETDGVSTANTHRANSRLDWYLTRNFFVTPSSIEVFHDPFSNINVRLTPGSSLGYHVFRGRFEWSVEAGLGYQWTRFESVDVDEEDAESNGAVTFGTEFELELTRRVDFEGSYALQLTFPELGNTNHNAYVELSVELTKILDLDLSFNWDRIEEPRETSDGEQPEQNDYRMVIALGLEF